MRLNKEFFMQMALNEAKKAYEIGEVPIGAICVCENEIISLGHNKVIINNDPTEHAEIVALRSACRKMENYRLKDVEIYVTVEPCPMCVSALINARIKSLIFGAYSDKWGYMTKFGMDISLFNHKIKVYGGILSDHSEKLLKGFFEEIRSLKEGGVPKWP